MLFGSRIRARASFGALSDRTSLPGSQTEQTMVSAGAQVSLPARVPGPYARPLKVTVAENVSSQVLWPIRPRVRFVTPGPRLMLYADRPACCQCGGRNSSGWCKNMSTDPKWERTPSQTSGSGSRTETMGVVAAVSTIVSQSAWARVNELLATSTPF